MCAIHMYMTLPIYKNTAYPITVNCVGSSIVSLEPAATKGQRAESLVDMAQQLLRTRRLERHAPVTEIAHIVRHFPLLDHIASAGAAESLNRVDFVLLHAGGVAVGHDGHGLTAVDLVRGDVVAAQAADALDWVHGSVEGHFVGLHHLQK